MVMIALTRFWNRLIEPHPSISGLARHRVRMLSAFFVLLIASGLVFTFIEGLANIFLGPRPDDVFQFLAGIAAVAIQSGVYFLSRGRRSTLTGWIIVGIFMTGVLIAVITNPMDFWYLHYLIFPVFVSSMFLSQRETFIIFLVSLGIIAIPFALIPDLGLTEIFLETVPLILVNGLAVLASMLQQWYIQEVEQQSKKLASGEAYFRALIENAYDAIILFNVHGKIVYTSPSTERITGYSAEKLVKEDSRMPLHPDDVAAFMNAIKSIHHHPGAHRIIQFRLQTEAGDWKWLEASVVNLLDDSTVRAIVANYHDITERKLAEEKIAQDNADLGLLNSVNEALSQGVDLQPTLNLIANELRQLFDCTAAAIYLVTPNGQMLEMESLSIQSSHLDNITRLLGFTIPRVIIPLQLDRHYTRLLAEGKPQMTDDLKVIQEMMGENAETLELHEIIRPSVIRLVPAIQKVLNVKSAMSVPLVSTNGPVGLLELSNQRSFTQADLNRASIIIKQLTIVIERKQAEMQAHQQAKTVTALFDTTRDLVIERSLNTLLNTIVERATNLLGASGGGLYLCEPAQHHVRCVVSYNTPRDYTGVVLKYGEGAAGKVAQTGKPLIVNNYGSWDGRAKIYDKERPFRAVLSVPMIWQNEVMGVIHVLEFDQERQFTEAEQQLVMSFANQAAIAVQNARLIEQEQANAARLETRVAERTHELEASLQEKEILLREVYHRVKNNLQVVNSLINLQSASVRGDYNHRVFAHLRDRLSAMALVHEQLYRSPNLAKIEFSEYLQALANNLLRAYAREPGKVRLTIKSDPIWLGLDTAVPCSLILNELISNSLGHAIPEDDPTREIELTIGLRTLADNCYSLTVADNGIGLPKDMDWQNTSSLGLQLVLMLVEQLSGSIQLNSERGTAFTITFSELKYSERR